MLRTITASMVATALLLSAPASFAQTAPSKTKFSAEDVFALEYANDVSISPDGQHIVYVRQQFDEMTDGTKRSLWLLDVASGQHTPLFADDASYGNPTWSADSTRLAFTSNRGGKNQIHVYWLATQTLAAITAVTASPSQLSWSPDGRYIAFTMNQDAPKTDFAKSVYTPKKPKGANWAAAPIIVERTYYQRDGQGVLPSQYRQVFVVPSDGGSARQLTTGAYNHNGPLAWRADSSALIFSANRNDNWEYQTGESDLWEVQLKSTELTQLTDRAGAEFAPAMSLDGNNLAYLWRSSEPEPYHNNKLQIHNFRTAQSRTLQAELDRSLEQPKWLNESQLTVQYTDRAHTKVAVVGLNDDFYDVTDSLGGTYISRPYLSGMYSVAPATGQIAFTHATAYRPADVAVISAEANAQARVLTDLNADLLDYRELASVNPIRYRSSFDGTEIEGWYMLPPNYDPNKRYPTMVEIHGGPHLAYGPVFAAEHQRYAAEGFVVFYNNYRGSTSYGKDFAMLLDGFYSSERDFADHMSGLDQLIEMGIADPDNLFIAGGSAGGIATAFAVGLTDRFNAAAATNPVINWISKTLTADSYLGQIRNQFPGMPWQQLEHYWNRSPLSVVENVTTPTLLFTGEKDRRTPISETEQFYQALQLKQVDTAMVRVPDAYHGVTARPSRIIAKVEHTVAWFKRYLKNQ